MRKQPHLPIIFLMVLLLTVLACRTLFPAATTTPSPETSNTPSPTGSARVLATPVASMPAAGICATFPGKEASMSVNPDIPDPRCMRVRPDQILVVVNNRDEAIDVQLGPFMAHIEPGEKYAFETPFGEYLDWGVHVLSSTPCCGGEIWLDPDL